MVARMQPGHVFQISSHCPAGACLGVAFPAPDVVILSETRNGKPIGPRIGLLGHEWAAFLAGAKAGEFDPPEGHAVTP